jgi:hypothetical protein
MRYCPECGTGHECTEEQEKTERDAIDRDVEIARLNTHRDIEVARISASAARDISETESDAEVAHAEGVVEGVGTALDAVSGGQGDDPGPGDAPVVIEAPEAIADDAGGAPDDAPPETGETEGSAPPAAAPKKLGLGAW